jgi:hypothetical protein
MSLNSRFGQPPQPSLRTQQTNSGCLAFLGLPFAGFGGFALVTAVQKFREGAARDALMLGLFGLLFGGVGLGLMVAAVLGGRKAKQQQARHDRHPDSPWLWREDWAAGIIRPGHGAAVVGAWVFAVLWNAVSWMGAIAFLTDSSKPHPLGVWLLVFLFLAVGVAVLGAAVHATLVARRFGASQLRLKTTPALLGGILEGLVELSTALPKDAPVQTRLTCLRRETTGSGKHSRTSEIVVWQAERSLRPGLPTVRPGRSGIPLYFQVPAEQPPSTSGDLCHGSIIWRVEIAARIAGPDLKLHFDVPVFPGEVPPEPTKDSVAELELPVAELRQALHSPITVTPTPQGGKELVFPALRNKGAAGFLVIFGLIWTGATVFMVRSSAPVLFPIVFGGFNILIVTLGFDVCCRHSRLVADRFTLTSTQRWLFLKRYREFRASEISELFLKAGMTSGTKVFHDLKVRLNSGQQFTLASGVVSRVEAEWLLSELRRALGRG